MGIPREMPGPFRADQLQPGDRYELSEGHAIYCAPTGTRGSDAQALGVAIVRFDPAVEHAGPDAGFTPSPGMLRAPDVAVIPGTPGPGWMRGSPPLAIEYADVGQDEDGLRDKIRELLEAGTRFIWVVRMVGPRRVEVHEPFTAMRLLGPGETLVAEGVLHNPVPVEALYEPGPARELVLKSLLQREGYESLEAVHDEGRLQGELSALQAAVRVALDARRLSVTAGDHARISAETDKDTLELWLRRAVTESGSAEEILRKDLVRR